MIFADFSFLCQNEDFLFEDFRPTFENQRQISKLALILLKMGNFFNSQNEVFEGFEAKTSIWLLNLFFNSHRESCEFCQGTTRQLFSNTATEAKKSELIKDLNWKGRPSDPKSGQKSGQKSAIF